MNWTEEERLIVREASKWVDEVHTDTRKGTSLDKYVIEVHEGAEYLCHKIYKYITVPANLVGTYKMRYATDLEYLRVDEAIMKDEWVRCEQVEVVVKEWRNIDE